MQRSLIGLGMLGVAMCAIAAEHRPAKFSSERYRFSVVIPRGWYYVANQDLPIYFNFPAQEALPQGQLPKGGAEIDVLLCEREGRGDAQDLKECRDRAVSINLGSRAISRTISMPSDRNALMTSFEEPPLGMPGQKLRHVAIFWRVNKTIYEAMLTFQKVDPKGLKLQADLIAVVSSFDPY